MSYCRSVFALVTSLLLFCRNACSQQPENILVLVDGDNDCCAGSMHRIWRYARDEKNMRVMNVVWSNFKEDWSSGTALTDEGKQRFVKTGKQFLRTLPAGTNIYMIGHSWGGDSALRLVQGYDGSNINFRLLALIDPVGSGGLRSVLVPNNVPSKVEYFYNRWQENQPFPFDYTFDGTFIDCDAQHCDQEEQSHHKNADGTTVRVPCESYEVTCVGWKLPGCNLHGCWSGSNGNKAKRAGHSGLATDGWVEESLKHLIGDRVATPPPVATVAIRATSGHYISAENGGGGALVANRDQVSHWERFQLVRTSDGWYAFRTYNGNYVKAQGGGGGGLIADASAIGDWEKFLIIDHGGDVSVQTINGHYLCAEGGGGREVVANRQQIGAWETFELNYI